MNFARIAKQAPAAQAVNYLAPKTTAMGWFSWEDLPVARVRQGSESVRTRRLYSGGASLLPDHGDVFAQALHRPCSCTVKQPRRYKKRVRNRADPIFVDRWRPASTLSSKHMSTTTEIYQRPYKYCTVLDFTVLYCLNCTVLYCLYCTDQQTASTPSRTSQFLTSCRWI